MNHSHPRRPLRIHQFEVSEELGGANVIALGLAERYRARGDDVRLWVPGPGAAEEAARARRLDAFHYPLKSLAGGKLHQIAGCLRLAARISRVAPGIAHVHCPLVHRLLSPALRLARLRTVAHVHLDPEEEGLRWALESPPDLVVTCAEYLTCLVRSALEAAGSPAPVVTVPNAVDTEQFFPANRMLAKEAVHASLSIPLVLMSANLAPHKGQTTAVRAVARLKDQGVRVDCWLAGVERGGSGRFTQEIETLIDLLALRDRVKLLGFRGDMPQLLRAADVLVLPSTNEGMPLAILEAQATKVPVIAAPTAGIPEIIRDATTGFLVPADDVEGYAGRIRQLVEDRALHRHLAEQAFAAIQRDHRWSTFAERIARLYDMLLYRPAEFAHDARSEHTEPAAQDADSADGRHLPGTTP